jgi:hypothetical protein
MLRCQNRDGVRKRRAGKSVKAKKKGRKSSVPPKKTQKKNSNGQFPLLVKKFHEEWMRAEIRTRTMLRGVKVSSILVGSGRNTNRMQ